MENIEFIKREKKNYLFHLTIILIIVSVYLMVNIFFIAPKRNKDIIIHINENLILSDISKELENKKIIKSAYIFNNIAKLISLDKKISSGDYLFKKNLNLIGVLGQLSMGKYGVNQIKITFTEGMTNDDIVNTLSKNIEGFRKDLFLSDKRAKQGYLFPDTYFFFPKSTTDEILNKFQKNFIKKMSQMDEEVKKSGKSIEDIIIMASIIEKEASGKNDASIISGILWKRLEIGMMLQVDASPITYKELGLPEFPIANPGLSSIKAAINPINTPYLFYLHDNNRNIHYSTNFSEHRSNIARYLK